jgi:glycosyltransferase involved in cell wall biosynthesis
MGMGIPMLLGVGGESAELVEKEGVGIPFEPENPDALCAALIRLRQNPDLYQRLRDRCLQTASRYDRDIQAAFMLSLITRFCDN